MEIEDLLFDFHEIYLLTFILLDRQDRVELRRQVLELCLGDQERRNTTSLNNIRGKNKTVLGCP